MCAVLERDVRSRRNAWKTARKYIGATCISIADVDGPALATQPDMARSILPFALASFSLSLAACGSSQTGPQAPHYNPPDDVVGTTARCEKMCELHAQGQTLDQLCTSIVEKTKGTFAHEATCKSEAPMGIWIADGAAVHDAAFVDVETNEDGETMRYVALALSTDKGWELAHEVARLPASAGGLKVLAARAADVPGLQPFGVEIKVQLGDAEERVFVCGVSENAVTCPVAVQTS